MREILFSGKRFDNGEWIEGSLFTGDNGECEICYGTPRVRITYEVIPETVGQFTGLYDKNGKKIFEGDIVYSIYSKRNYVVGFGEYSYEDAYDKCNTVGWYTEHANGIKTEIGTETENWAVIVGNIHDNPELLEGETE